jgi:nicotinamide-nucleotide amidase
MSDEDMFPDNLRRHAENLLTTCVNKRMKLATAESCTGGAIAALLSEIPGCSKSLDRGFVTYSNEAKTEMLGVEKKLIETHGAVSEEVAVAMVRGALKHSNATIAVSVTGIAGPDGGTPEKPVGMVCIAVAADNYLDVNTYHFTGNRKDVRLKSVANALHMLDTMLSRSFSSVA